MKPTRIKPPSETKDIQCFEHSQETLALLRILALGNQQVEAQNTTPLTEAFNRIRAARKNK